MSQGRFAVCVLRHADEREQVIFYDDSISAAAIMAESFYMKNAVIRTRVADRARNGLTAGDDKALLVWGVKPEKGA